MEHINEVYRNFPIRDQDEDVRRVSDLLQAWGAPTQEAFRARIRRRLGKVVPWFLSWTVLRDGADSLGVERKADTFACSAD